MPIVLVALVGVFFVWWQLDRHAGPNPPGAQGRPGMDRHAS